MGTSNVRADASSILMLLGCAVAISGTLLASSVPLIQTMNELDLWNATSVSAAFQGEVKTRAIWARVWAKESIN